MSLWQNTVHTKKSSSLSCKYFNGCLSSDLSALRPEAESRGTEVPLFRSFFSMLKKVIHSGSA